MASSEIAAMVTGELGGGDDPGAVGVGEQCSAQPLGEAAQPVLPALIRLGR